MKKFIKENWFKITILLIIVGIALAYLFIFYLPNLKQVSALQIQEKCSEVGQKAHSADVKSRIDNEFYEPLYGYNKKLNTCIYFGGYYDDGNPSNGVSSDKFFKHNCDAQWEQWVKNSYTNEKIISIMNMNYDCKWTQPTEDIQKFQDEKDKLFSNE